jgi:hypothetical protein
MVVKHRQDLLDAGEVDQVSEWIGGLLLLMLVVLVLVLVVLLLLLLLWSGDKYVEPGKVAAPRSRRARLRVLVMVWMVMIAGAGGGRRIERWTVRIVRGRIRPKPGRSNERRQRRRRRKLLGMQTSLAAAASASFIVGLVGIARVVVFVVETVASARRRGLVGRHRCRGIYGLVAVELLQQLRLVRRSRSDTTV